jgi:Stress responsive A/B Barrel Domain
MIRHVVVFRWDDEMTDAIEQQLVTELNALAPTLPGVRSYRAGPDAGVIEGNWDFAVVGDFDDVDRYLDYRDHPQHQDIISRLSRPHSKERASVQYRV